MICPTCSMPPIPPTQMRPGDLPICYNGHTLYRPFGPEPPPLQEEKIRTRHKGKRLPDLERGQLIRSRADQLGITLSRLGKMCRMSDSVGYSAARGTASSETFRMLEEKLNELEAEGIGYSLTPKGNFHC